MPCPNHCLGFISLRQQRTNALNKPDPDRTRKRKQTRRKQTRGAIRQYNG